MRSCQKISIEPRHFPVLIGPAISHSEASSGFFRGKNFRYWIAISEFRKIDTFETERLTVSGWEARLFHLDNLIILFERPQDGLPSYLAMRFIIIS